VEAGRAKTGPHRRWSGAEQQTQDLSHAREYAHGATDATKDRDVSEADTVTIVKDLLAEVFGYDKYAELTGEFAIRGTYCDLASVPGHFREADRQEAAD
jgi:hypothetical protein